jgi:hypothetical protein
MIKSIALEYHWPPSVLSGLYFDSEDWEGIEFWYKDIEERNPPKKK